MTRLDGDAGLDSLPVLALTTTRSDLARIELRRAISEGRLAPNVLYSVQSLAAQLGVSRTPVREALLQLVRVGMVRAVRNRGFEIVETTGHDIQDIFEIRLLLEVPAVCRAAVVMPVSAKRELRKEYQLLVKAAQIRDETALWRHDRAFHQRLLEGSGNQRLAHYIDGLRDLVLVRGKRTTTTSRSATQVAREHRPILLAVERSDPEEAAEAMRAHLAKTAELLAAQESASLVAETEQLAIRIGRMADPGRGRSER